MLVCSAYIWAFFVGTYMRVCKKMVINMGIKTPQSRKERKYMWQQNARISSSWNDCKYTWEKTARISCLNFETNGRPYKIGCFFPCTRDIEKCPLFVLTGVCIKRVNFRENVWAFPWDKQNCLFYVGANIKCVSVECSSTLVVRFDSVYWVLRLDVHVLL